MSARVPVYDTGMLIALADRKAKTRGLPLNPVHTTHREVIHRCRRASQPDTPVSRCVLSESGSPTK